MNKLIQYFRYSFYSHFLAILLGVLGVLLIAILYNDYKNTPMIILILIFIVAVYLMSRNSRVHFLNDTLLLDSRIIELFETANNYLFIITPYLNAGKNRLNSIVMAKERGCDVTVLVNSKALINKNTVEELSSLQSIGCYVFIHPNLHSKIYLNEKRVITGSVNLVKGSFDESLEIGIETEDVYEHKNILGMINQDYLAHKDSKVFNADKISKGYCIRSKTRIIYNVKSPIERSTYLSSADRMTGKYCHKCGKDFDTTVSNPLCDEHK